ncbi:MAG TPA: hypothetical protein VHW74_14955 [Mycobacteriales bacterium]|jgi:hypothetical protein|nr:hypothetical protein [Mycobacteriales bacterium]
MKSFMSRLGLSGVVFLLCALGCLFIALEIIVSAHTGHREAVTIDRCEGHNSRGSAQICYGSYTEDGELHDDVAVNSANDSDIGKTISVHVHGDKGTSSSLRLPIIAIVVGAIFAGAGIQSGLGKPEPAKS